ELNAAVASQRPTHKATGARTVFVATTAPPSHARHHPEAVWAPGSRMASTTSNTAEAAVSIIAPRRRRRPTRRSSDSPGGGQSNSSLAEGNNSRERLPEL